MARALVAGGLVLLASLGVTRGTATAQPATGPKATVRGRVVDSMSRGAVGQAEVFIVRVGPRAFTGDDGRFLLEGVTPGACTLSVVRMGYRPFRRALELADGATLDLDLPLVPAAVPLAEITVTPGSFSFMGEGTGTRQTMTREDVQAVPQIGEDIFRAVNRLPGLASNDYSAHFGIRGGRHDETLILLDGLQIHEPYHLKDFNEGAISIVDAETIDGVQLMTGGFPARYGDKRSGVFDITSRQPEEGRTSLDVGVSLMNTRAMGRGTFAGDQGSWLAFGRIGYMGPVFAFIDQADLPKPDYEDVFAKASFALSPRHHLSLNLQHAGDRYVYDIAATTGFNDTIATREGANTKYGNSYLWTTLRSTLGPHTTVRTVVSGSLTKKAREGYERQVGAVAPHYAIRNDRTFTTFTAAQDWSHAISDHNLISLGVDYRDEHNDDKNQSIVYGDPNDPEPPDPGEFPILTNTNFAKDGARLSAYVSDRWRVASRLVLELGARYDQASWTGDADLSPRVSAAMTLGHGMTARLGWGYYRQMQGIDDVATLNNNTSYYPSERSQQWTAGWDRVGDKGSVLRIEGYWKRGTQLRPVYRNWKGAIDAFPEVNEDRMLVEPHDNTAKGAEIYFDRPLGEHWTARASYSFAIADENVIRMTSVNNGDALLYDLEHPNPQDQRHAANADLTYRLNRWTMNGSFAFHSGWPATHETLVPVVNDQGQPDSAVRPLEIYGERLPDYMRLDMRITRHWPTRFGRFGASLEVINLSNHANVFGYDYFRTRDANGQVVLEQGEETWFSIFPNVGVTWGVSY
jgi:hypothetical protein